MAGIYTMYVNPFMVVNNMKFTKHYYMGSQRVVSKLGEMGAHQDMLNPREMKRAGGNTIQWDNKEMKQKEQLIAGLSGAAPACAALHFLSVKTRAAPVSAAILHT